MPSTFMEPYTFATSTQLDQNNVSIRIGNLEGYKPPIPYSKLLRKPELQHVRSNVTQISDLYVTVQLYADGKPLGVPVQTAYKSFKSARVWNEWLELPVHYSDIPITSQLAITLWDLGACSARVPFGGTTVKLFDEDGTLKKGRQKLNVWLDVEADGAIQSTTDSKVSTNNEMDRLEQLLKKQEIGEFQKVDWLDQLAYRHIEHLQKHKQNPRQTSEHYLFIEFPRFDFPVVFSDYEYPPLAITEEVKLITPPAEGGLISVYDPEAARERDNPCEMKHMNLVRSQRNGISDRELKPNARIRDQLNDILKYPPTHELNPDEKNMVWKFRYYLTRDKHALTKFLKSVVWLDNREVRQVIELLPKWAEVDIDDALEMLGPASTNAAVRSYAVDRLRKADDDELVLYLLQLVQALKFEKLQSGDANSESSLAQFLITRAAENETLGTLLHWYLMVESEDQVHQRLYAKVDYNYQTAVKGLADGSGSKRRSSQMKQTMIVELLTAFSREVKEMNVKREKKIERLKAFLADPANGMLSFDSLPLPLDPRVSVVGVYPQESSVFKSSLLPLKITFKTAEGTKYPILFKNGDDLRQDQLVIQIIILMDQLLQKENLDLKLSPYRIVATSSTTGMMQFVPSSSIQTIVAEYGTILSYLKKHFPDPRADRGVKAEVMDTYVKSCAGYCVITYLLGVGDRHLDNLLVTTDGHFFHADFGYILGKDPKIFAPQMKLCKEMVDGMGGSDSIHFLNFKSYCFTTYTTLRKSANLILNLFAMMVDANIPDIRSEPDTAVLKVQEKFALEVSEEEAIKKFEVLIVDSLSALFPIVIDRLHWLAQYWKS